MKNKFLFLFLALFLSSNSITAQNSLSINNPNWWWDSVEGIITEPYFSVRPHGAYAEVGMYMTFNMLPDYFSPSDSLEIVFDFTLPAGAMVVDSWLWINDEIIKADIMDKWSASMIYEEIVDRQQDPSLLVKTGSNTYQLRIYPFVNWEGRKVKITYLVPTTWKNGEVEVPLPIDLLTVSSIPVNDTKVRIWAGDEWGEPTLRGSGHNAFTWEENSFWETTTTSITSTEVVFQSPSNEGVYVGTSTEDGNKLYQVVIQPQEVFDLPNPSRRILVGLEYLPGNSWDLNRNELLNLVKTQLLNELSSDDYFNLMVPDLGTINTFQTLLYSEEWIPAHPDSIEAAFSALATFPQISDLREMFAGGLEFIRTNGDTGNFVLFTNSDFYSDASSANGLIEGIMDFMGRSIIPIHICDFQNRNLGGNYINNTYYRGNEYLYSNLARLTGGEHINQPSNVTTLWQETEQLLNISTSLTGIMDMYTTLEEGFTYQRYNIVNSGSDNNDLNKALMQVGWYQGEFPFNIELNASFEGSIFHETIVIDEPAIAESDSMLREMWAGNYLADLEQLASSNNSIQEVIDFSINERILSDYTAFLCLEPSLGGEPCWDCFDEGEIPPIVSTEEGTEKDISLKAYPNPFSDQLTLEMTLPPNLDLNNTSFILYDAMGNTIRVFKADEFSGASTLSLVWNGLDKKGSLVPAGVYYFVVQSPDKVYNLKLICIR